MAISIILADDHPLVHRGMRTILEAGRRFFHSGRGGKRPGDCPFDGTIKTRRSGARLNDAGVKWFRGIANSARAGTSDRIVILSMHSSNAFIAQALQNGAIGYVLKGGPEEDLIRAVRDAAAGRRFLSPPVTQIAIDSYIEQFKMGTLDPHETLTPRQRQVLQLAAEGKTNAEIAEVLHISQRTVENHRSTLMQRLNLQNQTDLIRHAIRHGLIPLEE